MFLPLRIEMETPILCALAACCALLVTPAMAGDVDWDGIDAVEITLFQPGQHSWEWLLIPGDHGSNPARRIREGRPCLDCHKGEEAVIGNAMVAGNDLEPEPLTGMPGSVDVQVKVTLSGDRIKLRLSWPAIEGDGPAGVSEAETMLTVAIGDGDALPPSRFANCWMACHTDMARMPAATDDHRTKYLPNSRTGMTRSGGADNYKDPGALAAELDNGAFLEFWTVFLDCGEISLLKDGYILEVRNNNENAMIKAVARIQDGRRVVELSRPLAPGQGPRRSLVSNREYPFSIALHENHAWGRQHYVSFPHALMLGDGTARVYGVTESE